jgi:hypothetical protein
VDLANMMCLTQTQRIKNSEDIEFGIGNLSKLATYCDVDDTITLIIDVDKEKFEAKRTKGNKISFTAISPKQVATAVEGLEHKKLKKVTTVTTTLDKAQADELKNHLALIGSEAIMFHVDKKGWLYASSPKGDNDRFSVRLCKVKGEAEITTYAQPVIRALDEVDWSKDVNLAIGNGVPVLIDQGKTNFWAITPLA